MLDTSVLSLLAPGRVDASPAFLEWVATQDETLHFSTVSIAEIGQGIAKLGRLGGTRRAEALSAWLEETMTIFVERVLPFGALPARVAGELADRATASGFRPSAPDLYIAATAEAHGLTVLTRNLRHFEPLALAAKPIDPLHQLPG